MRKKIGIEFNLDRLLTNLKKAYISGDIEHLKELIIELEEAMKKSECEQKQ